jgi:hypothetical protein
VFGRVDPAGSTPARRDRLVARYLRREVVAYAPFWRTPPASSLEAVPARPAAALLAGAPDLVLRPDVSSVYRSGSRRLALRMAWWRLWGRQERVNHRVLVPRFKPVLWVLAGGAPVGYSAADADRLARIGARWLADAGVGEDDVLVSVLPAGPDVAWWQVVLGARALGVSAVHVRADDDVASLAPTVLVGRPMDLLRLLHGGGSTLAPRLVLAVDRPLDEGLRGRLSAAAGGAPVLSAWAPPGVRALWGECRGGAAAGLHTWPASEVVELTDPLSGVAVPPGAGGEVVWSALGWRGTVLLRLRTGVFATVDAGPCPACGRDAPRLYVSGSTPAFLAVLDRHPDVLGWQAELRTVDGVEELIVFLAVSRQERLDQLLREVDGELSATQYVVLDAAGLNTRVAAHDDARVVDLRPS